MPDDVHPGPAMASRATVSRERRADGRVSRVIDPLAFLAMAFLVVAAPGPAVAHVVACALFGGHRLAGAAIAGLVLGQAALLVTSLSAGAVLRAQAESLAVAQAGAGVVLLLVGLRAMRRAADAGAPPRVVGGRIGAAAAGLGIVAANPVSLPFLAAVAVAASEGDAAPWPRAMLLAAGYAATGLVVYGGYAVAATRLASARQAARWRVAMRGLAGAAIAAAGLACLVRVAAA